MIRTAIFDADASFSRKLMNYLNGRYDGQIQAVSFTGRGKLEKELKEGMFECVVSSEPEGFGTIPVIPIVEQKGENGYYRFGSAKELAVLIFRSQTGKPAEMEQMEEFAAVYSPSNGRLRTDFSWKKAKKTGALYFGMEEYCSVAKESSCYRMEEILFLIKERDEHVKDMVRDYAECVDGGVLSLPSSRSYLDSRYLKLEDYRWFLKQMESDGQKNIIFDIGIGNLTDFKIFGLFDHIYLVMEDGEDAKNDLFLKLLEQDVPGVREKVVFVRERNL